MSAYRLGRGMSMSEEAPTTNDEESVWLGDQASPEERIAQILADLCERMRQESGLGVKKPMVAIPGYFGLDQRRIIERAGERAGLDVAGFISTSSAVFLSFEPPVIHSQGVLVCLLDSAAFECSILRLEVEGDKVKAIEVVCLDGELRLPGEAWHAVADGAYVDRACEIVEGTLALAPTFLDVEALLVAGGSAQVQTLRQALCARRSWGSSTTADGHAAAEGAARYALKTRTATVVSPGPSDVLDFFTTVGLDQASNLAWVILGYAASKLMRGVRNWRPREEITPEIAMSAAVEIALAIDATLSESGLEPVRVTHLPPGHWEVELALPSRRIVVALTHRGQRIEGVFASDERFLN